MLAFSPSLPLPRITHAQVSPSSICRRPSICCASSPDPPTSIEAAVALAAKSVDNAISAGVKRVRVTALIPGLNPIAEDTYPFSLSLQNILARALVTQTSTLSALPDASLLFESAGTAAAASAQYTRDAGETYVRGDDDDNNDDTVNNEDGQSVRVKTASFAGRDFVEGRASKHANVLVAPVSSRGDPIMDDLEAVIREAPDAVWVLFNARLDVDRAAVGMAESTRRASFEESFEDIFYFRNLFEIKRPRLIAVERGAILKCFGQAYQVFGLADGEYVLGGESDELPLPDFLNGCVRRARAEAVAQKKRARVQEDARVGGLNGAIRRLFGL